MQFVGPFGDPRFWIVMGVVVGYAVLTSVLSNLFLWELEDPIEPAFGGMFALVVLAVTLWTGDLRQHFIQFIALVAFFAAGSLIDRAVRIIMDPSIRGWVDRWFPPQSSMSDMPFKSSAGKKTQSLK